MTTTIHEASHVELVHAGLQALAMGNRAEAAVRDVLAPTLAELDIARDQRDQYRRALTELVEATGRLEHTDGSSDALFGVLDMRTRACSVLGATR